MRIAGRVEAALCAASTLGVLACLNTGGNSYTKAKSQKANLGKQPKLY
jgi:hypothetical protein